MHTLVTQLIQKIEGFLERVELFITDFSGHLVLTVVQ